MTINQPLQPDDAERKAELIEQSKELIGLFGFEKGRKFSPPEIKEKLGKFVDRVKQALLLIYENQDPAAAKDLASQPEVQLAFLLNIQKMAELDRRRKNGDPYYVHPQSVSQKFIGYSRHDAASLREGVIGSLLHDYLEEGDGVSLETATNLRQTFSDFSPEMAEDLALLTQPNYIENGRQEKPELRPAINYDVLKKKFGKGRDTLETILFSLMMRYSKLMQMVVPVDELDNVDDCEIVQRSKAEKNAGTPEETGAKYRGYMAKVLATFLLSAENCDSRESLAAKNALLEKINQKLRQLQKKDPALKDLDEAVRSQLQEYHDLLNNKELRETLILELKKYFRSLGLNGFVERLNK